jgi:F-box interacting protein
MTILNVDSEKRMCRFTDLAAGYSPVNGFLLLASGVNDWPLYVCNPVTGEKVQIPAPPRLTEHVERRVYAMGFSPSTQLYKLFHLSFPQKEWPKTYYNYLDVYTLGATGDGRWRRHQDLFDAVYNLQPPPPVLVDGKLYVVVERVMN